LGVSEKNNKKIAAGWYIPVDVRDKFAQFCAQMGSIIQEDCAGALIVWQHLPPEIRELAKLEAKGLRGADEQFWADFEAGLRLGIRAQLGSQPQKPEKGKSPRRK